MKNAPMRFNGLGLSHNPSKLRISDSANIMELISPGALPDSRYLGRGLRVISGEGELYGGDCLEQYGRLNDMYMRGESGVLSFPHLPVMYAYLKELSMTAEPIEDVLGYSFVFVETRGPASADTSAEYITLEEEGSLWDIAYEHGADIDTLAALNPHIPFIAHIGAGEKVRLC